MLKRGQKFRWLGETPDGRRSSSWTAWVSKNSPDAYLANRALGGEFKMSFHASGIYQTSFLSDKTAARWTGLESSRHLDRWERPPEFAPGWRHLFEVILPGSEMRTFREAGIDAKSHTLLPCGPDHAVHVYLMNADLSTQLAALTISSGAHIATLDLGTTARLVVIATIQEWSTGKEILRRERSGNQQSRHLVPPGLHPPSDRTRWLLHGTHVGGLKFIIDAAGVPVP